MKVGSLTAVAFGLVLIAASLMLALSWSPPAAEWHAPACVGEPVGCP